MALIAGHQETGRGHAWTMAATTGKLRCTVPARVVGNQATGGDGLSNGAALILAPRISVHLLEQLRRLTTRSRAKVEHTMMGPWLQQQRWEHARNLLSLDLSALLLLC